MLVELLVFIAAAAVLVKSSEWVVRHATHISATLGISAFAIGFILISVTTSLPEFAVAIFSSTGGAPGLSVGNVLGANLTVLTLVLGLVVIFGGTIILKKKEIIGLIELLFITSLVSVMIFQGGELVPFHGLILLALFGYLVFRLYNKGKIPRNVFDGVDEKKTEAIVKLFGSLALLVIAAHFLVDASVGMAHSLGISNTLIGATLISLSTTMPELSVELRAVKSKQYALALGDLFGSAVTNVTLVLGTLLVLSTGRPKIDTKPILGILPIFFMTLFFIWYTLTKRGRITKQEGMVLIGLYALFLVQEFQLFAFFG